MPAIGRNADRFPAELVLLCLLMVKPMRILCGFMNPLLFDAAGFNDPLHFIQIIDLPCIQH